jgi:hypothetical protein
VFLYSKIKLFMGFRPPIDTATLHDIAARRDPRDIVPLLWEIKRLRGMVLRANQVIRELPERAGPYGIVQECLRKELVLEPCVIDEEDRKQASR